MALRHAAASASHIDTSDAATPYYAMLRHLRLRYLRVYADFRRRCCHILLLLMLRHDV